MVALAVVLRQVDHDLQNQEIGPRHNVPRAPSAQAMDELFQNA